MAAYFVQPPKQSVRNTFSQPFTASAWILLFFTWISVSILIYYVAGYTENFFPEMDHNPKHFGQDIAFVWTIAAACQKGWQTSPKCVAIQLILFSTLSFSFFAYNAYTAMLLSDLRQNAIPIRSLNQLMSYVKAIYMSVETGASVILEQSMEKINPERAKKVRMDSARTGWMKTVLGKGTYCFVTWPEYFTGVGRKLIGLASQTRYYGKAIARKYHNNVDHLLCQKFSSFPYTPFSMKIAMFVHKESAFARAFNYRILVGLERGLIRGRYWRKYARDTRLACVRTGSGAEDDIAITFLDTGVLFQGLIFGQVLCMLALVCEKILSKKHGKI